MNDVCFSVFCNDFIAVSKSADRNPATYIAA